MKRQFRKTSLLLMLAAVLVLCALVLPSQAKAASAEDLTYWIDGNEVVITGIAYDATGTLEIPDTIEGYPVTRIDSYAFNSCQLTHITVPDSVTSIGSTAFAYSSHLTGITLGNGVTSIESNAFYNCFSLTEITVPDSVKELGHSAFAYCNALTEAVIGEGVTRIERNCFNNCTSLTSVTLGSKIEYVPQSAFYGCSNLTYNQYDNAKYLGNEDAPYLALLYPASSDITSVEVADTAVVIGQGALADCYDLEEVIIPDSVRFINNDAFLHCNGLTSVDLGRGVEAIGESAFNGCHSLQEISIPAGVSAIDAGAFRECTGLTGIWVDEANVSYCSDSNGVLFNKDMTTLLAYPAARTGNYNVPDTVQIIAAYAFDHLGEQKQIVLPQSVHTLQPYAFNNAWIESIDLSGVVYIEDGVFWDCNSLAAVTLGEKLTKIGPNAFIGCDKLTGITIPASVTQIGAGAFTNNTNSTGIWVNSQNPNYSSDEYGVLFNKNKTLLVQAPGSISGSYIVPQSVTQLENYAFYLCGKLSSVTFGSAVEQIGSQCFDMCTALHTVEFTGDAPNINWCFSGVTATAYYPAGNATWESFDFYDYNGELTWTALGNLTGIEVAGTSVCVVNDDLSNILQVQVTYDNGEARILPAGTYTVTCDVSTTGRKTATVTYENYSTQTVVAVHSARQWQDVASALWPESTHNYEDNLNDIQVLSIPGASAIRLTFGPKTRTEEGWDYIYILDKNDTQIARLSGQIGVKTVEVPGDTVKIRMTSDGSSNDYGYDFSAVTANSLVHTGEKVPGSPASCTQDGLTDGVQCEICQELTGQYEIPALGHDYVQTMVEPTKEAAGHMVYTCSRCADSYNGPDIPYVEIATGTIGENITWVLTEHGTLTVSGEGRMQDHATNWSDYNNQIKRLVVSEGITYLGLYAFANLDELTGVTLPQSLREIGDRAFEYAYKLSSVEIPNGVYSIGSFAFSGCTSLTDIYIPANVHDIGLGSFESCNSLPGIRVAQDNPNYTAVDGVLFNKDKTVLMQFPNGKGGEYTVPDSVTAIDSRAFIYNWLLTKLVLPEQLKTIGEFAFFDCSSLESINIPHGLQTLGIEAFANCYELKCNEYGNGKYLGNEDNPYMLLLCASSQEITSIEVAEGTKLIEPNALRYCFDLTSVSLPDGILDFSPGMIEDSASVQYNEFGNAKYLGNAQNPYVVLIKALSTDITTAEIAATTRVICDYAFADCTALTNVSLPEGLVKIGSYAFNWCSSLTELTVPDSVTTIGDNAFGSCSALKTVKLGDGLETIGGYAFGWDHALTEIEIPDSVRSLGNGVFQECNKLQRVTLSKNLTEIPANCFGWCYDLQSIEIPEGVTAIGEQAFYCCYGMTRAVLPESLCSVGNFSFDNCSSLKQLAIGADVHTVGNYAFAGCDELSEIEFMGDAPTIGEGAFQNITVTAYYGQDGEDWAQAAADSYGGETTWTALGQVTDLQAVYIPSYAVGDTWNGSDIQLQATYDNGLQRILPAGTYTLSDCDLSKAGVRTATATYRDASVQLPVAVHEGRTHITVDSAYYPESEHNYSNNLDDTQIFRYLGAGSIRLTFSQECQTEGCDYIYVLDRNDQEIARYSHTNMAGVELEVPGDTVKIRMTSDGSVTYYGYSFSSIEVDLLSHSGEAVPAKEPTCTEDGHAEGILCEICNQVTSCVAYAALGHDYAEEMVEPTPEANGHMTYTCTVCGDSYNGPDIEYVEVASGACGADVTWTLAEHGTLTISGTGAMDIYADYGAPWEEYRSQIRRIVISDGVTTVGSYAFYWCWNLEDVTLADSMTEIGFCAFYGCESLKEIVLPDSVLSIGDYAFSDCYILAKADLGSGLQTIGEGAFKYCYRLEELSVPDTLQSMGSYVFWDCEKLQYNEYENARYLGNEANPYVIMSRVTDLGISVLKVHEQTKIIDQYAAADCEWMTSAELPEGLRQIGMGAFAYCSSLSAITVPEGVTEIGDEVFYGCSALADVQIQGSVERIGDYAFKSCAGLTQLTIPNTVVEICYAAFDSCTNLSAMEIPDSVQSIDSRAFYKCQDLEQVNVGKGLQELGQDVFNYCDALQNIHVADTNVYFSSISGVLFDNNAKTLLRVPTQKTGSYRIPKSVQTIGRGALQGCMVSKVVIQSGVTAIEEFAFRDCVNLTQISIPASVMTLKEGAFFGCAGLQTVTVPGNVHTLGNSVFGNCKNLQRVELQNGVQSIGWYVFADCPSLTEVKVTDSLESFGQDIFDGSAKAVLHCPIASVADVYAQENSLALAYTDSIAKVAVQQLPLRTEYPLNAKVSANGLLLKVTLADGTVKTASAGYTVDPVNTATEGKKTVTVHFGDYKVQYDILVDKRFVAYPESAHNYDTNCVQEWTYTHHANSEKLFVTFSNKCMLEAPYDYVYIYDGTDELVGAYTGKELAGKTVEIIGKSFRIMLESDGSKNFYGFSIDLIRGDSVEILTQPVNQNLPSGKNAIFSVVASGNGLKYQWQYRTSATGSWKNASATGNKTAKLTVPVTAERNGYQYRCKITDSAGNECFSDAATLKVVTLKITAQPTAVNAVAGKTAKFTVKASGTGLTYQWQYRTSTTGKWANASATGSKTATVSVPATVSRNGYQYRCRITDKYGNAIASKAATLKVLGVKTQPADQNLLAGKTAKFTVSAVGTGLTYQWQYRTSAKALWKNTSATGSKTAALSVSATATKNGYQYRCKITDKYGNAVYSNAATLKIVTLKVTGQPANKFVPAGKTAKFTVKVSGTGVTYQWQYRTSAKGSWKVTSATGNKTATLSVAASAAKNGYQYRCKITDQYGNVIYSGAATLKIVTLKITTQPASVTLAKGKTAAFKVAANGTGLTYQWQYRTSAKGSWKNASATGNKTATLKVPVTATKNGYQYRCVITDQYGNVVSSNAATLTVKK